MEPGDLGGIETGLNGLAQESVAPEHRQRLLSGAGIRLEHQRRRRSRRLKTLAIVAPAAMVLAGLLFVPISYRITVGGRITAEWPLAAGGSEQMAETLRALPGVAGSQLLVGDDTAILHLGYRGDQVQEFRDTIRATLAERLGDPELGRTRAMVFRREVGGSVLASLSRGRLRVSAQGLDEAELEQAIVEEIERWGAQNAEVQITITRDGRRLFDIRYENAPADSLFIEIDH
ncbi:MAG: hypothetical protein GY838_04285 [bacterium]|nr:hypothetical protein [bacterium]